MIKLTELCFSWMRLSTCNAWNEYSFRMKHLNKLATGLVVASRRTKAYTFFWVNLYLYNTSAI